MRKALFYGAALIGSYIVLTKATNAGIVLSKGASGASNVIKSLQGR